MKSKGTKQAINYAVGASAIATMLLIPDYAYAKGKKVDYDFTTNTIRFMQERPTNQKEHPFSVQELQIGGEKYAVKPIPKDKDIEINGVRISLNNALDFYLIPFSKSRDIIDPHARSAEIEGDNYVLVNIGMIGDKLCVAKELEERIINTDLKLKNQKIGQEFKITTRENKNVLYGIDGANITGERLLIMPNDQSIYVYKPSDSDKKGEGNFEKVDKQNFVVTRYDLSKIIINRETGIIQVKAVPYIPSKANFIDKEEPKKEEPKATIE